MKKKLTIRTVFGLAKCKELNLTDEELHLIVEANTGKTSLKELTNMEIKNLVHLLGSMKDSTLKQAKGKKYTSGNESTVNQRKKIYRLTEELGWNSNSARLTGFVKKMFGVDKVEWLDYVQCSKLIEALKGMVERESKKLQDSN